MSPQGITDKLVALFLAAALAATPGCAGRTGDDCPDNNGDGVCDDDVDARSGYYGGGTGSSIKKKAGADVGKAVSSGVKGGIGGSTAASAGG